VSNESDVKCKLFIYNEILTFIIYTWANKSVYSTNQPRYNSIFLSLTLKKLGIMACLKLLLNEKLGLPQ
jgi:hypothetical protein